MVRHTLTMIPGVWPVMMKRATVTESGSRPTRRRRISLLGALPDFNTALSLATGYQRIPR